MSTPIAPVANKTLKRRIGAAIGAAAIGVVTLASPASAQETTEPADDQSARLERACNRIPVLTTRTENVLDRINGDADTRGSLLWLDGKIVEVRERGNEDLAVVLENRRAVRESVIPVLETRLERLGELDTRCTEAGFGQ